MSLTFPASPTVGDTYTVGARTWVWSGTIWEITGTVAAAGSIGTTELASSAVTTAKLDSNAVHSVNIAANAVTQAKLDSTLSGITICTSSTKPASPFTGQTIFETDTNVQKVWLGSAWSIGTQHSVNLPLEALAVAGGGGACSYSGGAGGSEVITITRTLAKGTYPIVIGAAGPGNASGAWSSGRDGTATTLLGETVLPGGSSRSSDDGQGATYTNIGNGGGGSSRSSGNTGTLGTSVGTGVTRYGGKRGGQTLYGGGSSNQSPNYPGGGGGGAGASVTGDSGGTNATAGGIGVESSITGTSYYFGGGGGGGTYYGGLGANGGNGGGGAGSGGGGGGTGGAGINAGGNGGTGAGGNGGANTGGGGGGGRGETTSSGGAGGSGIVILRYLTADASALAITGGNAVISGPYTVRTFTASGTLGIA